MTKQHDSFTAGSTLQAPADDGRRRFRRVLTRTANVCLGASLLALPVAIFDHSGWWPSFTVAGFVLYLLLNYLRLET